MFVSVPQTLQFSEATAEHTPSALIQITAMELDKESNNKRVYRFSEAESIRKSIEGSPIFYGLKVNRTQVSSNLVKREQEHDFSEKIGYVEKAWIVGKKIKAAIRVTAPKILGMIKRGIKDFLFSVGGDAKQARLVKQGAKKFMEMVGAVVTHISMWKNKHEPTESGFESARVEKILEFQECVLYTEFEAGLSERELALMVLSGVI